MKKIVKTLIACLIALTCILTATACSYGGKYSTLKVKVAYYELQTDGTYEKTEDTATFSIKLYEHLTAKTCAQIKKVYKEGYWDNAVFYMTTKYTDRVMLGDLYLNTENSTFYEKDAYNYLDDIANNEAEFYQGGLKGNNLKAELGTIGLWRNIDRNSTLSYTNRETFGNGSNTVFIPTDSLASTYNNYFAIFGTLSAKAIELIEDMKEVFDSTDDYTEYVVFSYAQADNEGNPKTNDAEEFTYVLDEQMPVFNMMTKEEFDAMEEEDKALIVNRATYRLPKTLAVVENVK